MERIVLAVLSATVALFTGVPGIAHPGDPDTGFGAAGQTTTVFPGWDEALVADLAVQPDGRIVVAGSVRRCTDAKCTDMIARFALVRYLDDGSLDTSFGQGGFVTTSFRGSDAGSGYAGSLELQSDGRIVVGGERAVRLSKSEFSHEFALARYLPDGSLDRSFGGDGRVLTHFRGDYAFIDDVHMLPSGKIIAAGNSLFVVTLARYRSDGSLDPSFGGGDGRVIAPRRAGYGSGATIQPDGRIVTGGSFGDGCDNKLRWSLARFRRDGALDRTFGDGGIVHTRFRQNDTGIGGLAVQPDGRIVAAGDALFQGCGGESGGAEGPGVVARYRRDGSPDPSFGGDGRVFTKFFSGEEISNWYSDVSVLADGRILVVGAAEKLGGGLDWTLARYEADGSLDGTFGRDGKVVTEFEGGLAFSPGLAIDGESRPVLAGTITDLDYDHEHVGVARYQA